MAGAGGARSGLRKSIAVCAIALVAALGAAPAVAENGWNIPAGASFAPDKLARLDTFFKDEIAAGKIPGAILLISQRGKPVYFRMFGVRDVATQLSMTPDTIFRIHSMTKPITSFAAMMLVDEGKLKLDDPVAKYIPAFAEAKVGVEKKADSGDKFLDLVPLKRPITIRDLLLHTSGITYGFYGDSLVRKAYAGANLYSGDFDNAEFANRIARLPLAEQPGTLWDYGHSTDILGRVIEVVSGKSLYEFEKEKLLDPLGMKDTGFYIGPADFSRLAEPVPADADFRVGRVRSPRVPMKWESGAGGMVSTVTDFARFCQMLLNRGGLDGRQYLSPETFKQMVTDHIGKGSGVARDYFYFPGDGFGFGYGFGVRTDAGSAKPPPPGSLGEIKWDGASGTYFVVDFRQEMFFVLMQQTPSQRQHIQRAVKRLIYDALEK
jgi:CubicO group peptidase (beta-lactamase class C family)